MGSQESDTIEVTEQEQAQHNTQHKKGKSDSNLPEVVEERTLAGKAFNWGGSLKQLKIVYITWILLGKGTGASDTVHDSPKG